MRAITKRISTEGNNCLAAPPAARRKVESFRIQLLVLLLLLLLVFSGYSFAQTDGSSYEEWPPEELWDRFSKAKERKQYKESLRYIGELIERFPKNADYLYASADTLLLLRKFADAEAQFDQVLDADPDYLEAYMGKSTIYAKQKKEKPAKREMLSAAQKGYPVREMQKVQELRLLLKNDVRFFLELVERDVPNVDPRGRDPFQNPLQRKEGPLPKKQEQAPKPIVEVVRGDPEQIQRDKSHRMKDLLLLIQQHLSAGEEEAAREAYEEFKSLYHDVEVGKITKDKYREDMRKTWELAQERIYPTLRRIELKRFQQEAEAGIANLQKAYQDRDVEAARQYNGEVLEILDPKLSSDDPEFVDLAKGFFDKAAEIFGKVLILEDFQKNVGPFLKLTMTITSRDVNVALLETLFGGELKKSTLRVSDSLQGMSEFVVVGIEEERLIAIYKGEEVEVPLGGSFTSEAPREEP